MSPALIVIDVQQSFMKRPFWDATPLPTFLARLQSLADHARAQGVPVVQVFHTSEAEGPDGAFSRDSGLVTTLPGLALQPDAVFYKTVHSSLFAHDGTSTLDAWLRARGIDTLWITGIRTEQCCETTARHASDAGYRVDFISDATLTFPMQHPDGRRFSAEDIVARTELVLAGRFARIVSTDAMLAG